MTEPACLPLETSELHPLFGVDVQGCDLRRAAEPELYAAIRHLFEIHSLLLFRDQHLDDEQHLAFAKLFGPIEDPSNIRMDGAPKISGLSNEHTKTYSCAHKLLAASIRTIEHVDSSIMRYRATSF